MKDYCALILAACFVIAASCKAEVGKPKFLTLRQGKLSAVFDAENAGLVKLAPVSTVVPIRSEGGRLAASDFKSGRDCGLAATKVARIGKAITVEYQGRQLVCDVTYSMIGEAIKADGVLKNLSGGDRAILLTYTIPLVGKDLKFSPSLNDMNVAANEAGTESSVYPVAAMCGGNFGLALAIPPTAPTMFKLVGSKSGITLRLYLGLSPDTRKFPNAAKFSFLIYPCDGRWGFRDAIRLYYKMFSEYYTHHGKGDGLWLFQSEGSLPTNASDFRYDETVMNDALSGIIERDHKAGILTFPYMIVGQREIKHLPAKPGSYEEAMSIYEKWTPADAQGAPATKENVASGLDRYLKDEVDSSGIEKANGNYQIVLRNTDWGGESITFVVNPNPDLFAGTVKKTTGGEALAMIHRCLDANPKVDGIYIDSLGRAWCGNLNFRRDHFPYARYPLTFDSEGNVALHNQVSHYEFMERLRRELHAEKRLLFANGVYNYSLISRLTPEYGDVRETGRFFLAAILDIAGSEAGASPTQDRWEFFRTAMGPKPYLTLNYYWDDVAKVEDYLNHALCYGVFATNTHGFKERYWNNPEGHGRDKALYEWFLPLVRTLSNAGWQPVTYAKSRTKGVLLERYGKKGRFYFTVFNPGPEQECVVDIQIKSLGLKKDAKVEQISGTGLVGTERGESHITVRTKLGANRTAVIRIGNLDRPRRAVSGPERRRVG